VPPGNGLPPAPQPITGSGFGAPATPPADDLRGYPPLDSRNRPAPDPNLKPYAPPILGDLRDPKAILKPPQVGESQRPADPADANTLPVDIPQFAPARKGVASGQKPFVDGLDWLRNKGYRTVLHVRQPGENDSAARQQITAKGLRYVTLEVSPTTLNRDVIDEFSRIVTAQELQPLFAYDRDSSLLGGLWYLHFRLYEGQSHEKAAIEAGRLGLNIDADAGPHKDMWLAVQRYLAMSKPASRPAGLIHTAAWTRTR
jgi:hypothetical protein